MLHKHVDDYDATGATALVGSHSAALLAYFKGREVGAFDGQLFRGIHIMMHLIGPLGTCISAKAGRNSDLYLWHSCSTCS
jgi:hypothetical protein